MLDEVDVSCSRFRPSDLVRANRRPGEWTEVSPVLVGALLVALEAARQTDGRVDPCLGSAMEAAGYDRTFELLAQASALPTALPGVVRPRARGVRSGCETTPSSSPTGCGWTSARPARPMPPTLSPPSWARS